MMHPSLLDRFLTPPPPQEMGSRLLPSRRRLTFQGSYGFPHLSQEESPVFHVF